jgi:hypothetical protein
MLSKSKASPCIRILILSFILSDELLKFTKCNLKPWMYFVIPVLGAIIAIVSGVLGLFKFQ